MNVLGSVLLLIALCLHSLLGVWSAGHGVPHAQYWLPTDHLGSTAVTSGAQSGNIKYFPYGATRSGAVGTAYKFTGQRLDDSTGLYYYGARYYDPMLGRFISADAFVPSPGNPQSLNRYSYVNNNPLLYTDPSGHFALLATAAIGTLGGAVVGAVMAAGPQIIHNIQTGQPLTANIDPSTVAKAAAVGAATGLVAGATLGIGTAVLGTGFGATVASGAVSGAIAGQAGRATENVLTGQDVTAGLGNPADIAMDAAMGGVGAAVGYGIGRLARPAAAEATSLDPNTIGRAGEEAAGITGPKTQIRSPTGTANYRVPDEVVRPAQVLREIKNVARLSYTSQLRDYALYSQQEGYTFELITRQTTQLSGPLQAAIERGEIIWRHLPW